MCSIFYVERKSVNKGLLVVCYNRKQDAVGGYTWGIIVSGVFEHSVKNSHELCLQGPP